MFSLVIMGETTAGPAQYTFKELENDQSSLDALIPAGVNFASGIDTSSGRVVVFVDNLSDAAALEALALPESTVVLVRGLPVKVKTS